jgi:ribosomal protein S8
MFSGRINNFISVYNQCQQNKNNSFQYCNSKHILRFVKKLFQHNFIAGYVIVDAKIVVYVRFCINFKTKLLKIKSLLKPSRYIYVTYLDLVKLHKKCYGLGCYIVSTSSYGYLTDFEAIRRRVGGVLVCFIL